MYVKLSASLPSPISHLPSPISHLPSPISHLPSPISHLPSPISHLPSPISHLPSPISHLPSPISHLPSPISHLPSPISHLPSPISHLPSPISHLPSPISHLPYIDRRHFMLRRVMHNDRLDSASSSDRGLHHQFCLGKEDQNLAWNEGIGDVHDAVTGLGRLADVLFVGFAIWPEPNLSQPSTPSNIDVEVICIPTVTKLKDIVQRKLGVPHLLQFQRKLHQLQPGPGYVVDPETQQAVTRNMNSTTTAHRSGSSQLNVLPTSATTPHRTTSTSLATPLRTTPAHHITHTSTSASLTSHRSTPASASPAPSNASPQSHLSPTSPSQPTEVRIHARSSNNRQNLSSSPLARFNETRRYADIPAEIAAIRDERSGHFVALRAVSTSSFQEQRLREPAHEQHLREPAWIRTPRGPPPRNDLPLSPPPAYHTHITTSTFNFSPAVHAYLRDIEATPEVMSRIDASLDYSVDDWETCFVGAGLSVSQARNLCRVIVHSLPEQHISVLDIAQQSDHTRR
ncbi:uncharacterized protein HD556DRAFT_1442784 [Suillus plorans]|uniref:Uncharacterized protein n=1 Tax=Suillus plorans TaxID=116603 RepID=A0A9P7DIU0_9AGAM|nr:uncharacterized protein HD556DRAFT_1442784 [Suillus plorans]KAG1794599.1 hypothetical protein HD556DRAFT_1442784 [Suillus plorans]